jgi:2-haloacid dehalogenase
MQVKWVIFDLNGTLLDPLPISRDLPAPLNDTATALSLLNDTVFQAMADTLAGLYRPFSGYLAAAVARRLILAGCEPGPAVDEAVNSTVTAAGCLPPFAEAGQALAILADRGLRIATITNSPTAAAERALTAGGLRHRFEHVVGSDTCQAYKPALKVYVSGLRLIGADPGQACMVAAHGWDLLGAHQAGMQTAWVSRGEQQWLTSLPTPDVTGADLLAVARAIIAA